VDTITNLQGVLTPTELKKITHGNTSDNVAEFMRLVLQKCNSRVRKGKVAKVVQILCHYAQVFDVISQSHAELTAFLWGAIRWLIQVRQARPLK
jgi:hypothetical protein